MITFNAGNAGSFVRDEELAQMQPQIRSAHEAIWKKTGPGSDYLGWLDLPLKYDKEELARIRQAAARIRREADILIVIGIGGSYLGARAAIEVLSHSFQALLSKKQRKSPLVVFAGNNLSASYLADLFDLIEGKSVARQCHIQIRHDHRTGCSLPDFQKLDGSPLRPGRGQPADFRHHRQGARRSEETGDRRGV